MNRRSRRCGFISLQMLITIIACVISCLGAGYTAHRLGTSVDIPDRTGRLEQFGTEVNGDLEELKRRVTRLERPDEPVFPPRHPGRIGSTVSPRIGASVDRQ